MPTVDRVITRAWRELPDDVLGYAAFTNPDTRVPALRAQRALLPALLRGAVPEYSFAAGHWRQRRRVDDETAAAIQGAIERATSTLSFAAAWHRILLDEYPAWSRDRGSEPTDSPPEWAMTPSLELARRHGEPGPSTREVAWAALDRQAGPYRGPTAKDIQRHMRAHAPALEALLGEMWAGGWPHGSDPIGAELAATVDEFCSRAFAAQAVGWQDRPARDETVGAWNAVLTEADDLPGTVRGLTASSLPPRPALTGGSDGVESAPLDRSIADRLRRIHQGADQVVVQPLDDDGPTERPSFAGFTAETMVDDAIRTSIEPLGLGDATARAILLVIHRLTTAVSWSATADGRRRQLASVGDPALRHFVRDWHALAWSMRGAIEPGTTLERLLEEPSALLLGRGWTRAARTHYQETEWRPDARMAWEHATGVINSVKRDIPRLHYRDVVGRTVRLAPE